MQVERPGLEQDFHFSGVHRGQRCQKQSGKRTLGRWGLLFGSFTVIFFCE